MEEKDCRGNWNESSKQNVSIDSIAKKCVPERVEELLELGYGAEIYIQYVEPHGFLIQASKDN